MIFWTPQILPDDNITSSCPTMACLHSVPSLESEAWQNQRKVTVLGAPPRAAQRQVSSPPAEPVVQEDLRRTGSCKRVTYPVSQPPLLLCAIFCCVPSFSKGQQCLLGTQLARTIGAQEPAETSKACSEPAMSEKAASKACQGALLFRRSIAKMFIHCDNGSDELALTCPIAFIDLDDFTKYRH